MATSATEEVNQEGTKDIRPTSKSYRRGTPTIPVTKPEGVVWHRFTPAYLELWLIQIPQESINKQQQQEQTITMKA